MKRDGNLYEVYESEFFFPSPQTVQVQQLFNDKQAARHAGRPGGQSSPGWVTGVIQGGVGTVVTAQPEILHCR